MLKWMLQNKELLFAGAGIFVIGLLIDYLQKYFNHNKKLN